jgi:hypothetical protein
MRCARSLRYRSPVWFPGRGWGASPFFFRDGSLAGQRLLRPPQPDWLLAAVSQTGRARKSVPLTMLREADLRGR